MRKSLIEVITVTQPPSHLPRRSVVSLTDGGLLHFFGHSEKAGSVINRGGRAAELAAPPCSCSSLKDAMFSVLALLQTAKSVMTHALWDSDMTCYLCWETNCKLHLGWFLWFIACFWVFFVFFFKADRYFEMFISVFIPPKLLGWPVWERDIKHMNGRTRQRQKGLHPVFTCVIEWAGMGVKKYWLWLIKFLSLEDVLWRLLPRFNTIVEQCALRTSASP